MMASGILEHDHEQLSELLHGLKSDLQHDAGHGFELLDHIRHAILYSAAAGSRARRSERGRAAERDQGRAEKAGVVHLSPCGRGYEAL